MINVICFLFISLFIFSGCGSYVAINTDECMTNATWEVSTKKNTDDVSWQRKSTPTFNFKKRVDIYLGNVKRKEIRLIDLLAEKRIKCSSVKTLSISVTSDWVDFLTSFLPFISTRTVILSGNMTEDHRFEAVEDIMDDGWAMEWR